MPKPIEKNPTLVEYVQAQVERDRRSAQIYHWAAIGMSAGGWLLAVILMITR